MMAELVEEHVRQLVGANLPIAELQNVPVVLLLHRNFELPKHAAMGGVVSIRDLNPAGARPSADRDHAGAMPAIAMIVAWGENDGT